MKEAGEMATRRPEDGHPSRWRDPKSQVSLGRRLVTAWAVLAVLGLVATLLAACGGGKEAPAPSPTAEDEAVASCQALEALETYRYVVNWKLESPEPTESPTEGQPTPTSTLTQQFVGPFLFEYNIDASFVAPDRIDAIIGAAGGSPFRMITIGGQSWVNFAGSWMGAPQGQTVSYRPLDICEAVLFDLDLSQVEPQEEKVNDVKTLHYSFPQVPSQQAMAKIFGPSSDTVTLITAVDVDLWLAEKDGWPVRIDVGGSGLYADGRELRVHVSIDVRDANSGDIRVEPPL